MSNIPLHRFKDILDSLPEDEILIDVRSEVVCATGKIPQAKNIPLAEIHMHKGTLEKYNKVYCICASGNRSKQAQRLLTELGIPSASIDGGMTMWEQLNLPTESTSRNIPIMRQVLIAAGSLVFIGTLLSYSISTNWLLLTGFVGAGLIFAGVTGICTMSTILSYMPWNKSVQKKMQPSCATNCCTTESTKKSIHQWQQKNYTVQQFLNDDLAHYSYAILSNNEVALVDPSRNPEPYERFAKENNAKIVAIFETHPHADFISGHLEIAERNNATIYIHNMVGAEYAHTPFEENSTVKMGFVEFKGMHTPGHSPDSISILLYDNSEAKELFSGDTLFVHDVGRPDLREKAGNITAKREELAGMMYETIKHKLKTLADDIRVFPAHGAGSLCGKSLGTEPYTTIGNERKYNPAFALQSKEECVKYLTSGQPFIPKYFPHDVVVNKRGAECLKESLHTIPTPDTIPSATIVIDTRKQQEYALGHKKGAINIPNGKSFSTWLGSIIAPSEEFSIICTLDEKEEILSRIANIGYESLVKGVHHNFETSGSLHTLPEDVVVADAEYTIVDVRSAAEAMTKSPFMNSINIPLHELRERIQEIPLTKPILVHCAGGYRSAIGTSIIANYTTDVYDLGEKVTEYM